MFISLIFNSIIIQHITEIKLKQCYHMLDFVLVATFSFYMLIYFKIKIKKKRTRTYLQKKWVRKPFHKYIESNNLY